MDYGNWPIDGKALDKALESYDKAVEIDPSSAKRGCCRKLRCWMITTKQIGVA